MASTPGTPEARCRAREPCGAGGLREAGAQADFIAGELMDDEAQPTLRLECTGA